MPIPTYLKVNLEKIILHQDVPDIVKSATSSMAMRLSRINGLSEAGLLSFLSFHPIHVIKPTQVRQPFKCFAGLRGYQLSKEILRPKSKVTVIVHNQKDLDIDQESSIDPLLSTIIFGLDDLAYEADFLNIWKAVGTKQRQKIMPKLNNKKNLASFLNCSRRGLYEKNKKLISSLKKEIDKESSMND